MRLSSTAVERGYISAAFWFALRQNAGETPAIRWSVNRFKSDPQITQIRKIFLGQEGQCCLNFDFYDLCDFILITLITQIIVQTNCSRNACVSIDQFTILFLFLFLFRLIQLISFLFLFVFRLLA
ncbi:MAG: hypothetical protein LBP59_02505 [Planctomycetaceae bacterium]|nr:hypothetical protein [Planctomycetaceae bacterium]